MFIEHLIKTRDELHTLVEETLFNHIKKDISPDFMRYTLDGAVMMLNEDGDWKIVSPDEGEDTVKEPSKAKVGAQNKPDYKLLLDGENLEEFTLDKIEESDKYIGLYNPVNDKFCVRTISKEEFVDVRKKQTGQDCMTIDKAKILPIIISLKLDYREPPASLDVDLEIKQILNVNQKSGLVFEELTDDDKKIILTYRYTSKKDICSEIFKKLLANKKIFKSFTCGVTGALKKK